MACACKQQKKLENQNKMINGNHERKGSWYFIKTIFFDILVKRVLSSLFLVIACLVIMPYILLSLVYTQIVEGSARMIMPQKFLDNFNQEIVPEENGE